jgi:hypothetical protein
MHFQPFLMRVSSLTDNFENGGEFIISTSLISSPPKCTKDHCNHSTIILMHISRNPKTFSLYLWATCHSFASFHTSRNVWHPKKQCHSFVLFDFFFLTNRSLRFDHNGSIYYFIGLLFGIVDF